MDKKSFIIKYEFLLSRVYRFFGHNKIFASKGNVISLGNAFMKRCSINIKGSNNIIQIESGLTRLTNCNITIFHSNCCIKIGAKSNLNHCHLYIEDNGGNINIGEHVTITGETHLDIIEGKSITIGNDCLFSSDIYFRVGDSHSILNEESGKRINPSLDINVGNHVWIGNGVKILKGSNISDNSIIATGAIVTCKSFPQNVIIGGIPAKVLKDGINWDARRLPIE